MPDHSQIEQISFNAACLQACTVLFVGLMLAELAAFMSATVGCIALILPPLVFSCWALALVLFLMGQMAAQVAYNGCKADCQEPG